MSVLGFALATVIGLSLGLLGGGGSILAVPVLVYVLGFGMKQAVPMSLVVVGTTSLVGAVNHHRSRNIRWATALAFAPTAMAGAFLGGRLGTAVSSRLQLMVFATLMLAAAVSMYAGPALWGGTDPYAAPPARRPLVLVGLLGLVVGLITGFVGIGGGFLYVPALVLLGGLAMRQAVGTSLALIIVSCAAGLLGYVGRVEIPWRATALFTGLAVGGVVIGSTVVRHVPQATLRRWFAGLLVIMGLLVLLRPR
jgi:uncharacterized protein